MRSGFNDLWLTRAEALQDSANSLATEAAVVARIFSLIDECVTDYEKFFIDKLDLARIAVFLTIKGRNLALGSLSLVLDGLGQEAGALLRPLIEVIELLAYLQTEPDGVQQVIDGRLPSAGERAKKINGRFKELRDYLNSHASHVGVTVESMGHLIEWRTGRARTIQLYNPATFRANLGRLAFFSSAIAMESALLIGESAKRTGCALVTAESLSAKIQVCRNDARRLFFPEVETGGAALVGPPTGVAT
jgi:hypothetical protein